MRNFIDPEGNFIFSFPNDWSYKNNEYESKEPMPHSFEFYENSVGCFQINCKTKNSDELKEFVKHYNLTIQEEDTKELKFVEKFIVGKDYDLFSWMALVEDKFLLCSYTYASENRDSPKINEEADKARESLKTIMVIGDFYKKHLLASDRFSKFMTSYAASVDLTQRAYQNGSAVELTILLANQIDALLRLVLILKRQLDQNTNEIDTQLIHQQEGDRPVMEKTVYKIALDENIIDNELYQKLMYLYDQRNKVVHRYIITDLFTKDVFRISVGYSELEIEIGKIVKQYEQKQFQASIGIYGTDLAPDMPLDIEEKIALINALKEKHAHNILNQHITFKLDDNVGTNEAK